MSLLPLRPKLQGQKRKKREGMLEGEGRGGGSIFMEQCSIFPMNISAVTVRNLTKLNFHISYCYKLVMQTDVCLQMCMSARDLGV